MKKNNKIVMLVHDNRIDRRVLDEAKTLQEDGWELTVIAGPRPTPDYTWDEDCYPELKIVRLPLDKELSLIRSTTGLNDTVDSIDWSKIFHLYNLFINEALGYKADIYVAHDLPQLPVAINLGRANNAYVVYDTHELYPHQLTFGKKRTNDYEQIEDFLIQYVDKVITVNESAAKFLSLRYKIDEPEVILNSPPLDPTQLPNSKNDLIRKALQLDEKSKILLYQGGVARTKNDVRNLEKLVFAMKLVNDKNIKLVYMGPKGNDFDGLIELTKKEGLFGKTFFYHEAVPQTELLEYTISADVGIIPYPHVDFNSYFCTPNKLFEFLVVGLPILGNDSPELNRFIKQNKIGLTYPMRTVEDIAEAINSFFSKNIDDYKENGKELYKKYLWNVQGEKIKIIYKELFSKTAKSQNVNTASLRTVEHLIEKGLFKMTDKECNFILSLEPKNIVFRNYFALSKFKQGEVKLSEQIIKKSIEEDPENELLLDNLNYVTEYLYRTRLNPIEKKGLEDYLII